MAHLVVVEVALDILRDPSCASETCFSFNSNHQEFLVSKTCIEPSDLSRLDTPGVAPRYTTHVPFMFVSFHLFSK